MENFGRFQNITSKNETEFSDCATDMVMWNLEIKILYILGHTDNGKGRLQHPEQRVCLALTHFQRGLVR